MKLPRTAQFFKFGVPITTIELLREFEDGVFRGHPELITFIRRRTEFDKGDEAEGDFNAVLVTQNGWMGLIIDYEDEV